MVRVRLRIRIVVRVKGTVGGGWAVIHSLCREGEERRNKNDKAMVG